MQLPDDELFYEIVDKYRAELKTSTLTTYDIPKFITKNQSYEPAFVLRFLLLGNACSWRFYEVACSHYEKYRYSIDNLIEGITLKGILDS